MRKWNYALFAILGASAVVIASPVANAEAPKPGTEVDSAYANVPPGKRAEMQAQDKARSAASMIRWAVEKGKAAGFTGLELHEGSVRLWYKGTPPAVVSSAVGQARRAAPVEVLPARYSLAELNDASREMVAHLRASPGGPAHRVSIPVDGSGLLVGVDAAAARSASTGLPDVGVPVTVVAQDRVRQSGRYNDFAPFYGGGAIASDDGVGCTAAFGVRSGSQEYLLTAGHCGFPGQAWRNGVRSQWIGYASNEDVGQDLLMIAADGGGFTFTGVGSSTSVGHVIGWDWVYTGEELCSSGAVTTWLCGHVVVDAGNSSYCGYDPFGNWECYSGLVWSEQEDGWEAARNGDSGGPVMLPTSSGVVAKGVISGSGGNDLVWQDFATAAAIWGVTPIT